MPDPEGPPKPNGSVNDGHLGGELRVHFENTNEWRGSANVWGKIWKIFTTPPKHPQASMLHLQVSLNKDMESVQTFPPWALHLQTTNHPPVPTNPMAWGMPLPQHPNHRNHRPPKPPQVKAEPLTFAAGSGGCLQHSSKPVLELQSS